MALNNITASMMIVASMLGYGILTLPVAWAEIGYLGAIMMLIVCSLITYLSIELIFKSCTEDAKSNAIDGIKKDLSFFSLIENISPVLGNITNYVLIVFLFLTTIAYLKNIIFFGGKSIKILFKKDIPDYLITIVVLIIQYGLTFFENLDSLKPLSIISILSCLFISGLCVRYAILKPQIDVTTFNMAGFSNSFGFFIFALGCAPMIPTVFMNLSESANPTIISILSIIVGALLCFIMGFGGYFCGGNNLKLENKIENILNYLSIPNTSIRQSISSYLIDSKGYCITLSVCLFFFLLMNSYALQFFSARCCISEAINLIYKGKKGNNKSIVLRMINFIYVVGTAVIALYLYPQSLLCWNGIILGNYLGFILPAICYIGTCRKKNSVWFIIALSVILFGIASAIYSIVSVFCRSNGN